VVAESISGEKAVSEFELQSADPEARLDGAELEVAIRLFLGSSPREVRELLERISKRWAESEEFATAVDSVSIKLLPS
jgi:hypothetical protein